MPTASEILKTEKDTQLKWLRNQVNKNAAIFINPEIGQKLFVELVSIKTNNGIMKRSDIEIPPCEVYSFVNRCLTESAMRKLVTTLRVTASRLGNKQLQVTLSYEAEKCLNYMVKKSKLNKTDLVNFIIENAYTRDFPLESKV